MRRARSLTIRYFALLALAWALQNSVVQADDPPVAIDLTEPVPFASAPVGRLVPVSGRARELKSGKPLATGQIVVLATVVLASGSRSPHPAAHLALPIGADGRFAGEIDLMSLEGKVRLDFSAPGLSPAVLSSRDLEASGRSPELAVLSPAEERSVVAGDHALVRVRVRGLVLRPGSSAATL